MKKPSNYPAGVADSDFYEKEEPDVIFPFWQDVVYEDIGYEIEVKDFETADIHIGNIDITEIVDSDILQKLINQAIKKESC